GTVEYARYGYEPHDVAALEFAELIAQQGKHQFEAGRKTLSSVKNSLNSYAAGVLTVQVNTCLEVPTITSTDAPFRGEWEWSIKLKGDLLPRDIFLEFGPTAVAENDRAPQPVAAPDYSKLFVTRQGPDEIGIDRIAQ